MSSSTANPPARFETRRQTPRRRPLLLIAALIFLLAICACLILLFRHWPFAEKAVLDDLRETTDSQITIQHFRETYFPPGCVAERIVFRHGPSTGTPLITIDKLTVRAGYIGMLLHRVDKITAEGLRVSIPALGTGNAFHTTHSNITIGEFIANGSQIQIALSEPGKAPLSFDIHEADLREIAWGRAMKYRLRIHNPEPPGEVSAEGKFGSWNEQDAGQTPISGTYTFEHADLSVYDGIAGTLSSKGQFEGQLSHINISGDTDVPDFEVTSSKHQVDLVTHFVAYVDGMHGDTFLQHVEADFLKTHVVVQGSIAKSPNGKSKTAMLDMRSNDAHIEDALFLFVTAKKSPMSGSFTFQAHVELPPGDEPFLKKLKLSGEFGIAGGKFSDASTQKDVNKLSAGALGQKGAEDPDTVLTNLKGRVDLLNGVSTFHDITFHIPGAGSRLHGTYNLLNETIDLRGQMRVDTEIANTETGVKSALLKFVQPFFKRKKKGQIVPVRIAGTYDHPTFGLDLRDKRAQLQPLHPDRDQPHK